MNIIMKPSSRAHKKKASGQRRQKTTDAVSTSRTPLFRGLGTLLPNQLRVTVVNSANYVIPPSSMAPIGNYCSFCVSDTNAPFNYTYAPTRTSGVAPMNALTINGTTITQSALGIGFLKTLYGWNKVQRYKARVRVLSQGSSDNVAVAVFPLSIEQIPNNAATSANLQVMVGQPGCVHRDFIFGSEMKEIVSSGSIWSNLAIPKSQYDGYLPTGTGTSPVPAQQAFVGVFAQILDGSANTNSMPFEITLEQEVWFQGLLPLYD